MSTKHTRAECFSMARYWLGDVRHCVALIVVARNRTDRTAVRLALLKALCNAMEWRDKAAVARP